MCNCYLYVCVVYFIVNIVVTTYCSVVFGEALVVVIFACRNVLCSKSHLSVSLTLCTVTQGRYWGSAWGSCAVWSPLWVSCRTIVSNMAFGWTISLSFIWLFIFVSRYM